MQTDEDGLSLDVHSSSTEGTNSSHWAFNSVFGIVHAKNCSVCRSYIVHLADANHFGDTTFKTALHDRESRISEAFMDGIQTGRQLQHEDDESTLLRYREQRDDALKGFEEQKKELDAAREEIQRLQSRALPQAASNDPVVKSNNEAKSSPQSDASSSSSSVQLTPSVDLDDIDSDVDVLSPLSSPNHGLPMIPDIPTTTKDINLDQAASMKVGKAPIDSAASPLSSPAPESVDSLPGIHSYADIASQSSKTFPPATPNPAATPLTPSTQTLPNPGTSTSATTHTTPTASHPTSIAQAKALMSAAHAGDNSALEIMKSFCSMMHQIRPNQRTALHHYVAEHWRRPSRVPSAPTPESVASPSATQSSVEIASQPSVTPKPATSPLTPSTQMLPNLARPSSATTHAARNASHPTSIAQLQALMSAAHAGNATALETIRSFCSVMHQIPTNQRTELHHYVAQHWRSPKVSSTSKQRSFSTEIYVDATTWGVGFIMNGVWTAWKFPNWPPLRGTGGDMGWAKMLAVEVGLRTVVHWVNLMIHREGENFPLVITVQTDHWGIKREIEKRKSNKPCRQVVLQRILDMLSESNIQLTLKGIDPTENLASNPARGVPGLGATQLPFKPSLPSSLTAILHSISTNS